MLTVGDISAGKGEKKCGFLTLVDSKGISTEMPVVLINGFRSGPVLWITAGIHGSEYSGIEAAIRISTEITPQELKGALIILPVVNVPAFFSHSMFVCPIDNKNLNRVFPGKKDGSMSEIIAYTLMEIIAPKVSYLIDLHGGDMIEALHPFILIRKTQREEANALAKDLATFYGIRTLIEITEDTKGWTGEGTLYTIMAERGIPALLVEAGGKAQVEESYVSMHYNGIINSMKYLQMLPGYPEKPESVERFNGLDWVYCKHQGIFYSEVKPGEKVTLQQSLGNVRDYFGKILERVLSPVEGRVLFLVSSPAVKKDNFLLGIGKTEI